MIWKSLSKVPFSKVVRINYKYKNIKIFRREGAGVKRQRNLITENPELNNEKI
jgi:hypothetical protein